MASHMVVNTRDQLNIKSIFPGMEIPIIKIRLSDDSLIFIMGIPLLVTRPPEHSKSMKPWPGMRAYYQQEPPATDLREILIIIKKCI